MSSVHVHPFALRTTALAVRATLVALAVSLPAWADPATDDLTQRASTVEFGVGNHSAASAKANEFSGIKGKGPVVFGNVDLKGGGSHDSGDATRWRFTARNLGTASADVNAEVGVQGQYRINFGLDQLERQRSDSYQTPLLGAGTSVLTLPANWITPVVPRVSTSSANARGLSPAVTASSALVSGVPTAPTAANTTAANALQLADLPGFHSVNLQTQRTRYELGATVILSPQWTVSASIKHEDKQGLKPMGTVTRATGGDISTIIPDLIDQSTEQFNAEARYRQGDLSLAASYYGSLFNNHVGSMTWSNWALPANAQTMSTAPSNQFHQWGLTGSYGFSPTTRLVANLSQSRGTQNDAYLTASYTPLVPVPSLNGLVVTTAAHIKLTAKPIKDLSLAASYKLDDRDNRTAVNTYGFYDAGEAKSGTASVFASYFPTAGLGSNANLNANRPYSKKLSQINLDADYRLTPNQALKAGYEGQTIDRHCSGSWIACADASRTDEKTGRLEYRLTALDTLSARLSAAHSQRTVNYNEDAWLALVPAANLSPTGAPGGATLYGTMQSLGVTGYGPISGLNPLPTTGSAAAFFFANNNAASNALYANANRISELPGMRRYNMADRKRDKLRASADWQATEALSLQLGADYNADKYSHSVYGLLQAKSAALNLDASYAISDAASLNLFGTHEDQRSLSAGNSYTANSTAVNVNGFTAISGGCYATIALRNASNKVDPCLNWASNVRDKVDTFGLAYTHKGLAGGKLDLNASASLSQARTTQDISGGSYANNPLAVAGAPAGTIAAYFISATPLPLVKTDTVEAKVVGTYNLDKLTALRVGYRYQNMRSTDWGYDGMQFGGLAGVLPTNELAPSYTVHTVTLAYVLSFR